MKADLAPLLRVRLLHKLSQVFMLFGLWSSQSTVNICLLNSPWHLGPLFPCHLCVEELGRGGNMVKHWGGVVLAVQGREVLGLLARLCVRGESPGEVLLKVVDEPGRNLVTVSLEGLGCKAIGNQPSLVLLMGKELLWECKSYVFKRLLPHSVAEQTLASLLKYSC